MAKTSENYTELLNSAIINDDLKTVKDMHKQGFDFNQPDARDNYPIGVAVAHRKIDAVVFIKSISNININAQSGVYKTPPVLEALQVRDIDIFKMLLDDENVDISQPNILGSSILDQDIIIEMIKNRNLKEFYFAALPKITNVLKDVTGKGANIISLLIHFNRVDYINETLKHFIPQKRDIKTLECNCTNDRLETIISIGEQKQDKVKK